MDTEKELRKWLNRPSLSFVENLDFAMKIWNSIEFVLLSKQEIIVDEFCDQLPKLRKEHSDTKAAWSKINEFLSFRYASGTVNVAIKAKLVKALTEEAEKSINNLKTSPLILNALLITLENPSIQNYYKSNATDYAKFLGENFRYVTVLLQSADITSDQCKEYEHQIERILTSMRLYVKQTPFLDVFKSDFAAEILQILCELVIWTDNRNISCKKVFLNMLQELYFNGSQTKQLKQYFDNKGVQQSDDAIVKEFHDLFDVPMHVFLLVLETVVLSFRSDTEVQRSLFQYLLSENDGKLNVHNDDVPQQLSGLTIFILLLKKYEIPLRFDIDSMRAHYYLGIRMESIVNSYYTTHPYEVLNLLCAIIKLDPLIVEFSVCKIAVKFMLIAKTEETVWTKYEEFMFLVIEMYRKLSRAEKFISQLIKNLYETLSTMKLSKKLKRSCNNSIAESSTPQKKLKKSTDESISMDTSSAKLTTSGVNENVVLLEQAIIKECESMSKFNVQTKNRNTQIWSDIAFAFSPAISNTYTRFISGLVTKPSLVVWKSLIFTLKDYIQQLSESNGKCSENCIFLIEITSALLSQYFMGSRVAEQSDKSWDLIDTNRNSTRTILTDFGHAILSQEHNSRTMNAFLKLCYSASNFDLICWYYRPDSMQLSTNGDDDSNTLDVAKCSKTIHAYLTEKEWTTIEQRIMNFGKRECKANINKIYLQRLKAAQLFDLQLGNDMTKFLLSSAFDDVEQISDILNDPSLSQWFIENLNSEQKRKVCEVMLQSTGEIDLLKELRKVNNLEFIEILTFTAYQKILEILAGGKNSDSLSSIDFEAIFDYRTDDVCKSLSGILTKDFTGPNSIADRKHLKKCREEVNSLLDLLKSLPIGFCKSNSKTMLSFLNIIICRYFIDAKEPELAAIASTIFKGILHFGDAPNIFGDMSLSTMIKLLKDEENVNVIFGMVLERTREYNEINMNVLSELHDLLQSFDDNDQSQQRILLEIAVLVVGELSKDKSKKEHFEKFREILFNIIKKLANTKSVDWLLSTTLPAFVILIKSHIQMQKSKLATEADNKQFTILVKLYLKNSVDCSNPNSVRLLNTTLENKVNLQLNDEELKEIINDFWLNFKHTCNNNYDEATKKTLNMALKLIFDHKTTDEWIQLLTEVEQEIESSVFNERSRQKSKLLTFMAKCQLNTIKGRIFIGFFKNVARQINLSIRAKNMDMAQNLQWISNLLDCYTTLANNVQIPVSVELIDDILSFMTEINIKKIDAETFDSKGFVHLLEQMCSLCLGLIQHRSTFIIDRVPHFVAVFKDLLQTICWYKSNRSQFKQLEQAEVTMLAEMAHILERTTKCFAKHSMEVKRVAPYLLLFVINLMITNDRPTTLYNKVKTHIEYICYDLIAICDHRVEGFILRNCNEASKAVYENLHREYEKYFKFRGKV